MGDLIFRNLNKAPLIIFIIAFFLIVYSYFDTKKINDDIIKNGTLLKNTHVSSINYPIREGRGSNPYYHSSGKAEFTIEGDSTIYTVPVLNSASIDLGDKNKIYYYKGEYTLLHPVEYAYYLLGIDLIFIFISCIIIKKHKMKFN